MVKFPSTLESTPSSLYVALCHDYPIVILKQHARTSFSSLATIQHFPGLSSRFLDGLVLQGNDDWYTGICELRLFVYLLRPLELLVNSSSSSSIVEMTKFLGSYRPPTAAAEAAAAAAVEIELEMGMSEGLSVQSEKSSSSEMFAAEEDPDDFEYEDSSPPIGNSSVAETDALIEQLHSIEFLTKPPEPPPHEQEKELKSFLISILFHLLGQFSNGLVDGVGGDTFVRLGLPAIRGLVDWGGAPDATTTTTIAIAKVLVAWRNRILSAENNNTIAHKELPFFVELLLESKLFDSDTHVSVVMNILASLIENENLIQSVGGKNLSVLVEALNKRNVASRLSSILQQTLPSLKTWEAWEPEWQLVAALNSSSDSDSDLDENSDALIVLGKFEVVFAFINFIVVNNPVAKYEPSLIQTGLLAEVCNVLVRLTRVEGGGEGFLGLLGKTRIIGYRVLLAMASRSPTLRNWVSRYKDCLGEKQRGVMKKDFGCDLACWGLVLGGEWCAVGEEAGRWLMEGNVEGEWVEEWVEGVRRYGEFVVENKGLVVNDWRAWLLEWTTKGGVARIAGMQQKLKLGVELGEAEGEGGGGVEGDERENIEIDKKFAERRRKSEKAKTAIGLLDGVRRLFKDMGLVLGSSDLNRKSD